jgi:hypothetical protein
MQCFVEKVPAANRMAAYDRHPEGTMERAASERPRAVTVIGWTFLVLAMLRVLNNGIAYLYWRFGGLREGLPIPGISNPKSPLHFVDGIIRNLGAFVMAQAAIAAVVAIVAWNLLRLRPWARAVLETFCWIALLLLAAFTSFFIAAWMHALAGETGVEAARMRLWGPVVAACVAVLAGGLLGATIWFLRRPHVRRAFEESQR